MKYNIIKIILFIPILNILFDILFVFEPLAEILPYVRISLFLFLILIFVYKRKKLFIKNNYVVYLLLFYYAFLLFFSSDNFLKSFSNYLKFFIPIIFYSIFYHIIRNGYLYLFLKNLVIVGVLFILNFAIAQIFNLGSTVYGGEVDFYSGSFTSSALYAGSFIVVISPLFFLYSKLIFNKKYLMIIVLLIVILLLFSMRRTAIFAMLVGVIAYFPFMKNKLKYLKWLGISVLVFMLSFPLYKDLLFKRIDARSERFEEGSLEKEGRYVETKLIWDEIFSFKDIQYSFFGKQFFNSKGNYGLYGSNRPIHVDFNEIAHGSGITGLLLYLIFLSNIFFRLLRNYRKVDKSQFNNVLYSTGMAVFVMLFSISFSSGLFAVTYRTLVFSFLGGISGYLLSIRTIKN